MSHKHIRYTSGVVVFPKLLGVSQTSLCSVHHHMRSPYLQSQKKYIFLWKKIYFCGNRFRYKRSVLKNVEIAKARIKVLMLSHPTNT